MIIYFKKKKMTAITQTNKANSKAKKQHWNKIKEGDKQKIWTLNSDNALGC